MRSRVRPRSGLTRRCPGLGLSPPGEEDGRRVGVLSEHPRRGRRPRGEPVGHGKAVACEGDGGGEIARERKSAKGGVGFAPSVHAPGMVRVAGRMPRMGISSMPRAEPLESARGGRPAPRVEKTHGAAASVPDQPELIAADAGHVRVDHGEHSARGNGGVHRRAAGLEHLDARLGRRGMGTCDHTVRRSRRRPARFHVRLLARAAPRVIKAGQV